MRIYAYYYKKCFSHDDKWITSIINWRILSDGEREATTTVSKQCLFALNTFKEEGWLLILYCSLAGTERCALLCSSLLVFSRSLPACTSAQCAVLR